MPERGPTSERPLAQLARVRLANDHRACGTQPPDHLGVDRCKVHCCPAARLRSARAASASACFRSTTRKALSVGWLASMAASDWRTSSTDVTRPLDSRYCRPVRVGRAGWAIRVENIPALPPAPVRTRCETSPMRLYRDRAVVLRQHKL